MWKKDEERAQAAARPAPPKTAPPTPERSPRSSAPAHERATIGRSITIRGDVTGDEDLVIQGRIEGSVQLAQHSVTIGPEGRVTADIAGRSVTIEGQVNGNLRGQEQVVLRSSAQVEGDITSPRVVLEDGASFRGNIDMTATSASSPAHTAEAKSAPPSDGHKPTPTKPQPSAAAG